MTILADLGLIMLLNLMYHQIVTPDRPHMLEKFEKHLVYLKSNFHITTPLAAMATDKINITLTFDDAYFDFYHCIYPLLQKYQIKAILGIPTGLIEDKCNNRAEVRLNVAYPQALEDPLEKPKQPLCSFEEIKIMTDSGLVEAASHSHSHINLSKSLPKEVLDTEILKSKDILSEKLGTLVNYFIYPFGKFCKQTHELVCKNYTHAFRIGGAINLNNKNQMLYRIDADHIWKNNIKISKVYLLKLKLKYYLNILRGK